MLCMGYVRLNLTDNTVTIAFILEHLNNKINKLELVNNSYLGVCHDKSQHNDIT
jgi:hypothetical protein